MKWLHKIVVALLWMFVAFPAAAGAENMSVGMGATGNFFLIEGTPELKPGIGGHVYFDYRFAPQFSSQFTFGVSIQNGRDGNAGDNGLILLSIPTVSFKYYLMSNSGRIDPYLGVGVGLFLITEGSRSDGTTSFGFGANAGAGIDVYLTPALSANLAGTFHSIGMIDSFGSNNGKGLFPVTAAGGLAFHF